MFLRHWPRSLRQGESSEKSSYFYLFFFIPFLSFLLSIDLSIYFFLSISLLFFSSISHVRVLSSCFSISYFYHSKNMNFNKKMNYRKYGLCGGIVRSIIKAQGSIWWQASKYWTYEFNNLVWQFHCTLLHAIYLIQHNSSWFFSILLYSFIF